jgi:hypothetical protein
MGTVFALGDAGALEHRMDDMNQGSNAAQTELIGLMSDGVILWRLHLPSSEQADLWCLVFKLTEGFYLVLDDDPVGTKPYMLAEPHVDICRVVDRSDTIKGSLQRCGWADVDVE